VALAAIAYAALELSPWPAALFYRFVMNRGGDALARAAEKHVPPGVAAVLDQQYEPQAALDVYYPAQGSGPLPTIVWMHGGGFFAGSKEQIANYLKILAAKGYTAVAVGYSLAPASRYPNQLRQVNAALGYLVQNAARLRVDPQRVFLAGDSAGAQLAAQIANMVTVPSYAHAVGISPAIGRAQLRGVILYCGVYDLGLADLDGPYGHFFRTVIWAYSGRKNAAPLPEISVVRFVTRDFPPALISAGNGDPLLRQSRAMAEALRKQGAKVETLFFPDGYLPELPHEYQFNLDTEAGRLALERTLEFLATF
jgi:acetyl esterase/lipase